MCILGKHGKGKAAMSSMGTAVFFSDELFILQYSGTSV